MIEVKYFSDVLTKLSRNLGQLICLLCIGYIWIQSLNQFVGIYHEICRFIVTSLLTLYEKRLIGAVHNLRRQDFLIYDPLCRRFDFQACSLKNGKKSRKNCLHLFVYVVYVWSLARNEVHISCSKSEWRLITE